MGLSYIYSKGSFLWRRNDMKLTDELKKKIDNATSDEEV
jgi:hypothetical protein